MLSWHKSLTSPQARREFNIPHGRANAILLPHVIRYNAQKPTKFATFPKYGKYADYRYAQISRFLNFGGKLKKSK